jgi:thiol:disulfide interchange protein DsbD
VSSFTVFTAIAVGLAWPVVLIAFAPSLRRRVPKPGEWMLTLRQFLVFPLLATAAWLAWVVGRQAGVDAMGALLAAMTIMSLGLWLFGRLAYATSMAARYSRIGIASLSLALAVGVSVFSALNASEVEKPTPTATGGTRQAGLAWQPFTRRGSQVHPCCWMSQLTGVSPAR